MKEQNINETVANYLLTKYPNKFEIKGQSLYRSGSRTSNVVKDILDNDSLLDELGIFSIVRRRNFDDKAFNASVLTIIKDHVLQERNKKLEGLLTEPGTKIDPKNFTIYKDLEETNEHHNKDKFIVNNTDFSIVKTMSISTYKHVVGEEAYNNIRHNIPIARKVFDPYKINGTKQDKKWVEYCGDIYTDVVCINECIQPTWRYKRDTKLKITDEEKFFIETSFTSKSDLQYYIDAAYATIVTKMWSYVMLYGIKGTGKTTLIEMLIPCVGRDNYRKAPQNALKKEFNGYKKNKRLILLDEISANTNDAVNILKSDANKEFNVEEKSKDSESVQNFASTWIATNNISDWKFTYDERRFSVLELTKETTQERGISDEWMSELSERIETEEWAQAFFNYLEANRSKPFNTMSPHKSNAFWKVVYESLTMWEMKIVDEIVMGEKVDEVHISNLFDEKDRWQPTTHKKVTDFLENYRHKGEYKLGSYKRGKSVRSSFIIPSDKYIAPKNKMELGD